MGKPKTAIEVRPISGQEELDAVYRLVHDEYVKQGYCRPQPDGKLIHHRHLDNIPETIILVAVKNKKIVGTISCTWDGPRGFHVDEDFKEECDRIREEGKKLGAAWRIAVSGRARNGHEIVFALIGGALKEVARNKGEVAVFIFNPKHERMYRRLLNMTTVARKLNGIKGLSNAPAVLMRLDISKIPARWSKIINEGNF